MKSSSNRGCFNACFALLRLALGLAVLMAAAPGCSGPHTGVLVANDYPAGDALVIYRAFWQAVSFTSFVTPGATSETEETVPATDNAAYVVLARGWDPADGGVPDSTSFVLLQSQMGFTVHIGDTLRISVSDATFEGNCAAGSFLTQNQADFITQRVFPEVFAGLRYDAATCATTGAP